MPFSLKRDYDTKGDFSIEYHGGEVEGGDIPLRYILKDLISDPGIRELRFANFPWVSNPDVVRSIKKVMKKIKHVSTIIVDKGEGPLPSIHWPRSVKIIKLQDVKKIGRKFKLGRHAHVLEISIAKLTPKLCKHIVRVVDHAKGDNYHFSRLILDKSRFSSSAAIECLAHGIQSHPNIKFLGFQSCPLNDIQMAYLINNAPPQIEYIDLDHRHFGRRTTEVFGAVFKTSCVNGTDRLWRVKDPPLCPYSLCLLDEIGFVPHFVTSLKGKEIRSPLAIKELPPTHWWENNVELSTSCSNDDDFKVLLESGILFKDGGGFNTNIKRVVFERNFLTDTSLDLLTSLLPKIVLPDLQILSNRKQFGVVALENLARAMQSHYRLQSMKISTSSPPKDPRIKIAVNQIQWYAKLNRGGVRKVKCEEGFSLNEDGTLNLHKGLWAHILAKKITPNQLQPDIIYHTLQYILF